MPSKIVFGSLVSGNPILSNPSDTKTKFEGKFDHVFNTPKAHAGQLATAFNGSHVPTAWTSDPYYMSAQSSGADYGVSLNYDSGLNQLFAYASGTAPFGTAHMVNCSGCSDCLIVMDNGKQSGCDCLDSGTCTGEPIA